MIQTGFGEVGGVAPFRRECAHGVYGRRLVVVRPGMHALNAKALVDPQQLDRREVQLLLGSGFRDGPVEVLASDEIGQTDARDEVEVVLPRIIDPAIGAVLSPEALERRHDEVEIALDLSRALFRHLDGICDAVEHRQRVLLRAAFGIGIALAPHGDAAHRRNDQDARLVRRFARDVVAHRRRRWRWLRAGTSAPPHLMACFSGIWGARRSKRRSGSAWLKTEPRCPTSRPPADPRCGRCRRQSEAFPRARSGRGMPGTRRQCAWCCHR